MKRSTPSVGWRRWVPGLAAIGQYRLAWLRHDLVAGLALSAVLLPVGIAYAVASGVPPTSGLYATIVGLLAYALFGEVPDRWVWLGAAIIFASTLYVANREHLAHRSAAAGSARSNPGSKH